jgi:hypothetical protein
MCVWDASDVESLEEVETEGKGTWFGREMGGSSLYVMKGIAQSAQSTNFLPPLSFSQINASAGVGVQCARRFWGSHCTSFEFIGPSSLVAWNSTFSIRGRSASFTGDHRVCLGLPNTWL